MIFIDYPELSRIVQNLRYTCIVYCGIDWEIKRINHFTITYKALKNLGKGA
jgi:hypothetical protein